MRRIKPEQRNIEFRRQRCAATACEQVMSRECWHVAGYAAEGGDYSSYEEDDDDDDDDEDDSESESQSEEDAPPAPPAPAPAP